MKYKIRLPNNLNNVLINEDDEKNRIASCLNLTDEYIKKYKWNPVSKYIAFYFTILKNY